MSLGVYDVNKVVIIVLSLLTFLNTFSGPYVMELFKVFDVFTHQNVIILNENILSMVEHVSVN